MSVIGGALLIGSTIGFAIAGSLGAPLVDNNINADVVYGTGSGVAGSDYTGALDISKDLISTYEANQPDQTSNIISTEGGITENEIVLGGSIISGKMVSTLTDNKIPTLIDGKLEWDDGTSSKTKFNVHEEIIINGLEIKTTLDDNDYNSTALTNNEGITYKYIFEESLDIDRIGHDDADDLQITILGIEYEVEEMDSNSITIVSSEKKFLDEGESTTVDGVTFTVEAVSNDAVIINGVIIQEGKTKLVNGIKVKVSDIFYIPKENSVSFVTLKIGKEISETYSNGDEYIEDDDTWVWDINNPGEAGGYIGVHYDETDIDYDEDILYAGGSYLLPEDYAEIKFVGTTSVDYNDFEVHFDERDLHNATVKLHDNVKTLIIEGENEDSFTLGSYETDSIYFYNNLNDSVEIYFNDINGDINDDKDIQYYNTYNTSINNTNMFKLINDDSELSVDLIDDSSDLILSIDGIEIKVDKTSAFTHLGDTEEDAESNEVIVEGRNIGTYDNDIMDYYGNIIENPESNGDNDRVVIQVPSEQVYVTISILGSEGSIITDQNATVIDPSSVTSTDTSSDKTDNLIVVGGSCINSVAAKLLGSDVPICSENFTTATGVGAGQYLYQVFENPYATNKLAILIAGYNAADTTRGVSEFLAGDFSLDIGTKLIK